LDRFQVERKSTAYQSVYEKDNPLVSVCVGTYNRGQLLVERAIKSILDQTYTNLEIIIVGDCCTDNTPELVHKIKDNRVQFVNLPERGKYPDEPERRWLVAGTATVNHALYLAKGDFITHLDDDDEYMPERILKLVSFIQKTRSDIAWHL
jgi:glycosyltransferase involved in cell wall biosynthesis